MNAGWIEICSRSIARKTLKWAEQRQWVDHDNFLAYGVGLTFFTLGVVGLIGSDDIFAGFIVGNSFVSALLNETSFSCGQTLT